MKNHDFQSFSAKVVNEISSLYHMILKINQQAPIILLVIKMLL